MEISSLRKGFSQSEHSRRLWVTGVVRRATGEVVSGAGVRISGTNLLRDINVADLHAIDATMFAATLGIEPMAFSQEQLSNGLPDTLIREGTPGRICLLLEPTPPRTTTIVETSFDMVAWHVLSRHTDLWVTSEVLLPVSILEKYQYFRVRIESERPLVPAAILNPDWLEK